LLFGNLLIVPIEHSLVYVRPVYVQASGDNNPPLLRKVVVEYNNQVSVADTLPAALKQFTQFTDLPAEGTTPPPPVRSIECASSPPVNGYCCSGPLRNSALIPIVITPRTTRYAIRRRGARRANLRIPDDRQG
jgi:hypothetical protein